MPTLSSVFQDNTCRVATDILLSWDLLRVPMCTVGQGPCNSNGCTPSTCTLQRQGKL